MGIRPPLYELYICTVAFSQRAASYSIPRCTRLPNWQHHPILVRIKMACGRRFFFVDAGTVQCVIDLFCGRVLRVFGDTPVVEGGPFAFDDAGNAPRLVGRGPNASTVHLVSDIVPWKLGVYLDDSGDKPVIIELAFRGAIVPRHLVFKQRSSFSLTIDCPGGAPFKAQWFHRVAVDCPDADPTRLTCVMSYFMAYLDWSPSPSGRKSEVRVRDRIFTVL